MRNVESVEQEGQGGKKKRGDALLVSTVHGIFLSRPPSPLLHRTAVDDLDVTYGENELPSHLARLFLSIAPALYIANANDGQYWPGVPRNVYAEET